MASELQKYNSKSKLPEWAMQVEECRNSGMTVKSWCSGHNLSVSTYYARQKKVYAAVKSAENPNEFYEIETETPTVQHIPVVAVLKFGEYQTEIYRGADEETIACILKAVKRC